MVQLQGLRARVQPKSMLVEGSLSVRLWVRQASRSHDLALPFRTRCIFFRGMVVRGCWRRVWKRWTWRSSGGGPRPRAAGAGSRRVCIMISDVEQWTCQRKNLVSRRRILNQEARGKGGVHSRLHSLRDLGCIAQSNASLGQHISCPNCAVEFEVTSQQSTPATQSLRLH